MWRWYIGFLRGVSVNRIGKLGVVLTTSSFISFLLFELTRLTGVNNNAYAGLVSYLALPAIFVIGLILVLLAWLKQTRRTGMRTRELISHQFATSETETGLLGARVTRTVVIFTLANVVFLSLAGGRMLSFMDQPQFCGNACHSVMHPEWITYQDSPHARVACVGCHVGEGVDALVDSKLNGIWQMISVTFSLYEQPIPTPVRQLRPARETCEKCHWPSKFYGSRIKQIVRYAKDSASTPTFTTLSLKIDTGKVAAAGGIHWHVAAENGVRYASVNDERREISWVEFTQADGTIKRFENTRLPNQDSGNREVRVVDCVDCHNRATHIYEDPGKAIDKRLAVGLLPGELPFIKSVALTALTNIYPDSIAALAGIENQLYGFYQRQYPDLMSGNTQPIDSAIAVLRDVYRRNIHHGMNVRWGSYPNYIGHEGCFRCHNQNLKAADGSEITHDCTTCHSLAAFDSELPFEFLLQPDTTSPNAAMHEFLRAEYFKSMSQVRGKQ